MILNLNSLVSLKQVPSILITASVITIALLFAFLLNAVNPAEVFAAGKKKINIYEQALLGLKVLNMPADFNKDKARRALNGEIGGYDVVVVDIGVHADFKWFIKENSAMLLSLCEDKYFGALLLELPEAECKILDCYIISGEQDARDALRESVYDAPAMLDFIEKIRLMNSEIKNAHKKIRVKSIYCGLNIENTVKLSRVIKNYDERAAKELLSMIGHLNADGFNKLKASQRSELIKNADKIYKLVVDKKIKIVNDFSGAEYQKCERQMNIIKLLLTYMNKNLEFKNNIDAKNEDYKLKNEIISEYIDYYFKNDFYNKKVIIFNESILSGE